MIIRGLISICLLCLFLTASNAFSGVGPQLSLPDSTFDFGYVTANTTVEHVFWLHSTGDDTLHIKRIRPGWACTRTPLVKEFLAPGDSVPMNLTFNPKKLRGPLRRLPEITTNADPAKKLLKMTAWVARDISDKLPVIIKPYRFDLPQYGPEIIDSALFSIRSKSSQAMTIIVVDKPDEVDIVLPRQIAPRSTIKGIVRLKPSCREGNFFKSITFELGDEKRTRFTIPIEKSQRLPDWWLTVSDKNASIYPK